MDQSTNAQPQVLPPNPTPPVTPQAGSPGQPETQTPGKKSSGKKILLIGGIVLLLLLVGVGGYYFGTMKDSASVTPTPAPSVSASMSPTAEPSETAFKCEKSFTVYHSEKYPVPAAQTIPTGLEDQLFKTYELDERASGSARGNFKLTKYYGDVAMGTISSAEWIMNNINGKWKVIVHATQEIPKCETLQPYSNDLKEWQGACYKAPGQLTDILHTNEEYNQCK